MEIFAEMVKEVNTRGHLQPLLKGNTFVVKIEITGEETVFLVLKNDELQLNSSPENEVDAYLAGVEETIETLLCGKVRLREAVNNHIIHYEGSFRMSLFLEALFSLAMIGKKVVQENCKGVS